MKFDTFLHMRLAGQNDRPITSVEDWKELAPPKAIRHWAPGRSACELASLWCPPVGPTMPDALREILESLEGTRNLICGVGKPELRIRFDQRRGEPRNANMAFVYYAGASKVAVTIEAKADEPFGLTVAQTLAAARKRAGFNPRSEGVQRLKDLARALFFPRTEEDSEVQELRYQLLTAAAGSVAYARAEGASKAVLVVHEFRTTETRNHRHEKNASDLERFLHSLGAPRAMNQSLPAVWGPVTIPGVPLFDDVPPLFIARVVTEVGD